MLRFISFWFFVAVVSLAPLPYGSVHLWSFSLLAILMAGALAMWAVVTALRPDTNAIPFSQYAMPLVLLLIVLGWLAVQAASFTPVSWHHPIWQQTSAALSGVTVTGAISLDPAATRLAILRIATYAAVFWLAMHYGRSSRSAGAMLWAISIVGLVYALSGLYAHLSGSGKILFADKWAYQLSLASTFVNRNHYAVYAGMGMLAAFALLVRQLKKDAHGAFDSSRGFVDSVENLKLPVFVLVGIFIVIGSALLLTRSRSGVAFTGVALVVFVLLLNASGGLRKRSSLALIGGLMVGGILMFIVSGESFFNRVVGNLWKSDRAGVHRVTLDAIADAPLSGHGVGTFPSLFHMYRGPEFDPISPAFAAAHSVYLEFAAGAGIVAAIVYFGLQALVVVRCFIGTLIRRRNQLYPAIGCAAAVLVGLHSYFDFGPHMPGVAVTFAALMGFAFAQSWPTGGRHQSREK